MVVLRLKLEFLSQSQKTPGSLLMGANKGLSHHSPWQFLFSPLPFNPRAEIVAVGNTELVRKGVTLANRADKGRTLRKRDRTLRFIGIHRVDLVSVTKYMPQYKAGEERNIPKLLISERNEMWDMWPKG